MVLLRVPSAPWGSGCLLSPPTPAFVPTEPQYFRFEGVWLTETGMAVLRNLTMSPLHKRRQRKAPRLGALNGDGGLEGGDPLGPDDKKDGDLDADELLKAEGAPSPVGKPGGWGAARTLLACFPYLYTLISSARSLPLSLLLHLPHGGAALRAGRSGRCCRANSRAVRWGGAARPARKERLVTTSLLKKEALCPRLRTKRARS